MKRTAMANHQTSIINQWRTRGHCVCVCVCVCANCPYSGVIQLAQFMPVAVQWSSLDIPSLQTAIGSWVRTVCLPVCVCVCVCRTILKREARMGPGPPAVT